MEQDDDGAFPVVGEAQGNPGRDDRREPSTEPTIDATLRSGEEQEYPGRQVLKEVHETSSNSAVSTSSSSLILMPILRK